MKMHPQHICKSLAVEDREAAKGEMEGDWGLPYKKKEITELSSDHNLNLKSGRF